MNRIQFWTLNGLSGLVVLFLLAQILLARQAAYESAQFAQAQQIVSQGQAFGQNLQKLALRIGQVSQSTGDTGLKDLLARQQININIAPATDSGAASSAPAPPPAVTPAPSPTH